MRVSVITPAYNAEHFLGMTIESVQAQTFADWEMVVTDDGSQDGTAEVVRRYGAKDPRVRLFQQRNGGLAAARNGGIGAADPHSEFFIYLDADDLWTPDALESLLAALDSDPEAVAAHGLAGYIDENGAPLRPGEYETRCRNRQAVVNGKITDISVDGPTTFNTLIAWNCVGNPGLVLVRRTAQERVGLFDKRTNPSEDYDMWLRLSRLGHLAFVDKVILGYRRHANNMSGDEKKMRAADIYVRAKAAASPENAPEQSRLVRAAYRNHQDNIAADKLRLFRASLLKGRPDAAAKQLAYAAGHFLRGVRGLPALPPDAATPNGG